VSEKRDYYEILGISKGTSIDEIKKAYRALALKYHPDRNQGDEESEQKFKEATEAYEVLRDDEKRQLYDRFGHQGVRGSAADGGFGRGAYSDFSDIFSGTGFDDLFENLFSGMGGGFSQGGRSSGGARRGADLRYNLEIDLEDVLDGKKIKIQIPREERCGSCDGSGSQDGKIETCGTCQGSGQVRRSSGFFSVASTCPTCGGVGQIIKNPCRACNGSGLVHNRKSVSISIPPGVDTGTRIKVSGEGEAGPRGGPYGDLYVVIQVNRHEIFERDGADLGRVLSVPLTTALLGGDVMVETLGGQKVKLKIPQGTQPGTMFRIRGKGLPVLGSGSRTGDMLINALIEIPSSLSSKAKQLVKDLEAELGVEPGIFDRLRK
jgi:molecular chaperone DnaJ